MPRLATGKVMDARGVERKNLWSARSARRWEVGGRCKNGGRSNTFTMGLAFLRTLSETLESDPWRIFGQAFRGSRGRRWPIGGKIIFTFKGAFISTFALDSIGHTCSSIFPFGVRATAGAIKGKGRRSNRSSVVRKLGHVSRVAT